MKLIIYKIKQNNMEKIKRVWNVICAPMAFFLGAMWMLIGETGTGCLFIMFGANEVINRD